MIEEEMIEEERRGDEALSRADSLRRAGGRQQGHCRARREGGHGQEGQAREGVARRQQVHAEPPAPAISCPLPVAASCAPTPPRV
jgi:hypothetical protein